MARLIPSQRFQANWPNRLEAIRKPLRERTVRPLPGRALCAPESVRSLILGAGKPRPYEMRFSDNLSCHRLFHKVHCPRQRARPRGCPVADKPPVLSGNQQAAAPGEPAPPVLGFSRGLFEHAHKYHDVFQALRAETCEPVVTQRFKRLLTEVVRHVLRRVRPEAAPRKFPVMPWFNLPWKRSFQFCSGGGSAVQGFRRSKLTLFSTGSHCRPSPPAASADPLAFTAAARAAVEGRW